jgi:hypothetical protein
MSETRDNATTDITNEYPIKFGRWIRTSDVRLEQGKRVCDVMCECGTRAVKRITDLQRQHTSSCGCAQTDDEGLALYDDEPDLSPQEVSEILGNPPIDRPTLRSQCRSGGPLAVRPCPWASCIYRLPQFPGMSDSCALDVAERGRHTQVSIGRLLGLSKQRVDQIEKEALAKLLETNADLKDAIACFPHPEDLI